MAAPDSPEFRRWFGRSKVVDADGQPLVVYHGTAADFAAFSHDHAYSGSGNSTSGSGFYFTTSRSDVSRYAGNGYVMPVYLSIQNPLAIDFSSGEVSGADITFTRAQLRRLILMAPDIRDPDGPLANYDDVRHVGFNRALATAVDAYDGSNSLAGIRNDFFGDNADAWLQALTKVTGHDGAYSELDDGNVNWVAWSPAQVKSALGNRGTFDPTNPDITESDPTMPTHIGPTPSNVDPHPASDVVDPRNAGSSQLPNLHTGGFDGVIDDAADPVPSPELAVGDAAQYYYRGRGWMDVEITGLGEEQGQRVYDCRLANGQEKWGWAEQFRRPVATESADPVQFVHWDDWTRAVMDTYRLNAQQFGQYLTRIGPKSWEIRKPDDDMPLARWSNGVGLLEHADAAPPPAAMALAHDPERGPHWMSDAMHALLSAMLMDDGWYPEVVADAFCDEFPEVATDPARRAELWRYLDELRTAAK